MRRFLVGFLASIGVVAILVVAAVGAAVWWWSETIADGEPLPDRFALHLRFDGPIDEAPALDPIAEIFPGRAALSLIDYVDALDRAARDPQVTGVFADLSDVSLGLAQAQELRAAVFRFRASGKTAIAYSDSFEGSSNGPFYLASAFDRIWLQPSGLLTLTGLEMEFPFAAGLLEELGLFADFEQRYEYKGAAAFLTEEAMPPALRENMTRVAESLFGQVISGIASARRMSGATVTTLVDRGPLLASEALSNGLVDNLGYEVDALSGVSSETVGVAHYVAAVGRPHAEGPRIALIHLDGEIQRGDNGFADRGRSTSGALVDALEEVLDDDEVRALILRVSSPGGSYVASDSIRHAIERVRDSGRPVIVSFADIAASGGYFAALPGDHILAHPATLTGSIGVLGGKISTAELLDTWNINIGRIRIGENAGMFSPTRPFTDSQRQRLRRILDAIYADFTERVASARGLSADEIDALARGRIWTGEDAARVGLVDAVGGYAEALQLVRQAIGVPPDAPVERQRYPRDEDALEMLIDTVRDSDIDAAFKLLGLLTKYREVIDTIPASGHVQSRAPRIVVD